MMTAGDLIEALKAFDPMTPVVTGGFDESGFDDVKLPRLVRIVQVNEVPSHIGMYIEAEDRVGESFNAIEINF